MLASAKFASSVLFRLPARAGVYGWVFGFPIDGLEAWKGRLLGVTRSETPENPPDRSRGGRLHSRDASPRVSLADGQVRTRHALFKSAGPSRNAPITSSPSKLPPASIRLRLQLTQRPLGEARAAPPRAP
eukprot:scaffold1867_cov247-Pinguiococcus_pyrenoidosus.AAC.21